MARAKGTALITAVRFLRKERERALSLLPAMHHHYLNERVLDSLWYPEDDLLALVRAVVQLIPMERAEALVMIGRASVMADIQAGRYQHLHQANGLAGLPRRVVALWGTQHDSGEMRMRLQPPSGGTLTLKGYATPSREMCTLLIGYLGETLIGNGIADPQVNKTACVLDGATECEWTFRHKPSATDR